MTKNDDVPAKSVLNPDLVKRHDEIYNVEHSAAPLDSTGAHEGRQGEGWSLLWLVVMLLSVLMTIYFLA